MPERRPFPKVDSSLLAGLSRYIEDGAENAEDHVRLARARLRALAAERCDDRYLFEEEIGRGGMGYVYRVQDNDLRRTLAMKVARGPRAHAERDEKATTGSDPVTLARFLEEARVTGQLDHPGIVPLHELGIDEHGCVYFTMRLVRGRHLGEVFEAARTGADGWTRERVVEALVKVCDAMSYAHAKGVIHRDLKPENVMTGRFGEVYVMDWGVAKVIGGTADSSLEAPTATMTLVRVASARAPGGVTIAGSVFGTPAYMAPEQARGALDEVDERSDVFSLGAMLYHLLAGHPPYLAPGTRVSSHTVLMWVIEGPPKTLAAIARDAPRELVAVCEKAMARDKRDRYASVAELADDLRAWLRGQPVSALRLGRVSRAVRWCRRNPWIAALLVAVSLGGAIGLWRLTAVGAELVRQGAVHDAAATASMLETVNGLYASAVVARVDTDHVAVTHDWKATAGAIPLPATFLTELAEQISAGSGGTVVKHYSDQPFKFRGPPKLDAFGQEALAALRLDPDHPVTRFEELDGRPVLRYAAARRMGASCVNCHNTHPESPRHDWKEGEVRGVLEIVRPLDAEVQRTRAGVRGTLMEVAALVAGLTVLCAVALVRYARAHRAR